VVVNRVAPQEKALAGLSHLHVTESALKGVRIRARGVHEDLATVLKVHALVVALYECMRGMYERVYGRVYERVYKRVYERVYERSARDGV
jgi:hypothetical protein